MKKFLKIFATGLVAASLALTGCSTSGDSGKKTEETKKDIKVGFLLSGPITDGGYNFNHNKGRLYLEEQTGVETIYKESVTEDSTPVCSSR